MVERQRSGASADADQALAVPVEPASGLAPTGFDPSRFATALREFEEEYLPSGMRETPEWCAVREAVADTLIAAAGKPFHWSDCATSSAPAEMPGPCDCPSPWMPRQSLPRDATVLVTVVPGPAHSYADKCKPATLPAYIDEHGQICDCSTWAPDKGLDGTHWRTIAWQALPEPAALAAAARQGGDAQQAPGEAPQSGPKGNAHD